MCRPIGACCFSNPDVAKGDSSPVTEETDMALGVLQSGMIATIDRLAVGRDGAAVKDDQRPFATPASPVNGPRYGALARHRFPLDQYGRLGWRDLLEHCEDLTEPDRVADSAGHSRRGT